MAEINPDNPNFPQWQGEKKQGALDQVPQTFDLQQSLEFRFFIKRLPSVNFFINKMNIPTVTLPMAPFGTPFEVIPVPGDHITFDPLIINFRIDAGMKNFFALQEWLLTIASFKGGKAYERLAKNPEYTGYGIESEILVTVLNPQKNVVREIIYYDAWPTRLQLDKNLDATATEVQYFSATAIFNYSLYHSATSD